MLNCKTWRDVVAYWLVPVMLLAWPASLLNAQTNTEPLPTEQYTLVILTDKETLSSAEIEKVLSLAVDYTGGYISSSLVYAELSPAEQQLMVDSFRDGGGLLPPLR